MGGGCRGGRGGLLGIGGGGGRYAGRRLGGSGFARGIVSMCGSFSCAGQSH